MKIKHRIQKIQSTNADLTRTNPIIMKGATGFQYIMMIQISNKKVRIFFCVALLIY